MLPSSFKRSRGSQSPNIKEKDMPAIKYGAMLKMPVAALGVLAAIVMAGVALGQPPGGGHWQGPPPEAIQACEGKSPGDAVQFQTPLGDTITGTCREMQGRLVAVPPK